MHRILQEGNAGCDDPEMAFRFALEYLDSTLKQGGIVKLRRGSKIL